MIPRKIFFTKGVGRHKEKLQSFEMALRSAGIAQCNIVSVSSIFPPGCKILPRKKGLAQLKPGQVLYCVLARNSTNEPNRLLAASIGLAVPADNAQYGYLSEHHSFGEKERKAGDYAEDLAASMLASTLGVEFNEDTSYDERKEIWKISDKIVKTTNITQSSVANKNGLWTTVLAAAVFIMEPPLHLSDLEEREKAKEAPVPLNLDAVEENGNHTENEHVEHIPKKNHIEHPEL